MSSKPFRLGIPVVDTLLLETGNYVLRTRDYKSAMKELKRIRKLLTTKDLILAYFIGFSPDYPIPVGRYFTEVSVRIGEADEWFELPPICLYNYVTTGAREEVIF